MPEFSGVLSIMVEIHLRDGTVVHERYKIDQLERLSVLRDRILLAKQISGRSRENWVFTSTSGKQLNSDLIMRYIRSEDIGNILDPNNKIIFIHKSDWKNQQKMSANSDICVYLHTEPRIFDCQFIHINWTIATIRDKFLDGNRGIGATSDTPLTDWLVVTPTGEVLNPSRKIKPIYRTLVNSAVRDNVALIIVHRSELKEVLETSPYIRRTTVSQKPPKLNSLIKGKQTFSAYLVKDLISAAKNAWGTLPDCVKDLQDEGRLTFEIDKIKFRETAEETDFLEAALNDVLLISDHRECRAMNWQWFKDRYVAFGELPKNPFAEEKKVGLKQGLINSLEISIESLKSVTSTHDVIRIADDAIDSIRQYIDKSKEPKVDNLKGPEWTISYWTKELKKKLSFHKYQLDTGSVRPEFHMSEMTTMVSQLLEVVEAQSKIMNELMNKHKERSDE